MSHVRGAVQDAKNPRACCSASCLQRDTLNHGYYSTWTAVGPLEDSGTFAWCVQLWIEENTEYMDQNADLQTTFSRTQQQQLSKPIS